MAQIEPGEYKAQVIDWKVVEVPQLDNKLQIMVSLELDNGAIMTWKDFFQKKDGSPNQKTLNTLKTLGFKGNIQNLTSATALNTQKMFLVTVEKDGDYSKVAWINDPDAPRGGGGYNQLDDKIAMRKLAGLNLSVGDEPKKPKNFADDISKEELSF